MQPIAVLWTSLPWALSHTASERPAAPARHAPMATTNPSLAMVPGGGTMRAIGGGGLRVLSCVRGAHSRSQESHSSAWRGSRHVVHSRRRGTRWTGIVSLSGLSLALQPRKGTAETLQRTCDLCTAHDRRLGMIPVWECRHGPGSGDQRWGGTRSVQCQPPLRPSVAVLHTVARALPSLKPHIEFKKAPTHRTS